MWYESTLVIDRLQAHWGTICKRTVWLVLKATLITAGWDSGSLCWSRNAQSFKGGEHRHSFSHRSDQLYQVSNIQVWFWQHWCVLWLAAKRGQDFPSQWYHQVYGRAKFPLKELTVFKKSEMGSRPWNRSLVLTLWSWSFSIGLDLQEIDREQDDLSEDFLATRIPILDKQCWLRICVELIGYLGATECSFSAMPIAVSITVIDD